MPDKPSLVILDRDGTINIERNYLASVEGMQLLPGAADAIRMLNQLGCPVVVISNQPVIARGECSLETIDAIHQRMSALLADEAASVDAIYFCPHSPEDHCACRKPKTELLERARDAFHADLSRSFVVGDKCSDIQAGRNMGATTFLVRTGHGLETERAGRCEPHYIVNDLKTVAQRICGITRVRKHLCESAAVKRHLADSEASSAIADAAGRLAECVARGGKIMLCGNGGSASDSQHIAAEFTNRLRASVERPGIPALALTTDTSYLTARGNDYGFDDVYERLVDTLGSPGDALIALSTSGNSPNVVRAAKRAKEKELLTIGLLGGKGGELAQIVDMPLIVPSDSVQYIQESHIAIGHILCELVEDALYGRGAGTHACRAGIHPGASASEPSISEPPTSEPRPQGSGS